MKEKILFLMAVILVAIISFLSFDINEVSKKNHADYVIILQQDSLRISDPKTGRIIYTESWDSKSKLVEKIINDNE